MPSLVALQLLKPDSIPTMKRVKPFFELATRDVHLTCALDAGIMHKKMITARFWIRRFWTRQGKSLSVSATVKGINIELELPNDDAAQNAKWIPTVYRKAASMQSKR